MTQDSQDTAQSLIALWTKRLFPKLSANSSLQSTFRQDLFLVIVAVAVGPVLVYSAITLLLDGRTLLAVATTGVLVVILLMVSGLLKNFSRAAITRIALVLTLSLAAVEIVTLRASYLYFWLTLVPLASMIVLGWREGLVWSAFVLLLSAAFLPYMSPPAEGLVEDFYLMFFVATAFSWAYEWLREDAQKIADQRLDELKASEKQLRAGELELAQAQKMRAIGQLTSGVAHDFNNMLMVVRGNLELASLKEGEAIQENLDRALTAVDSATDLIDKLLTFSRRKALRPESIDINEVVRSTETLLARSLGENIKLQLVLDDNLWRCKVDPIQLENSLINLAINARDAMPDGGTLTYTTKNITSHDNPKSGEPTDYVGIYVEDTGTGIPVELQNMVFEPFFTTKPPGAGSGLGLSMVHGFVGQSGGRVTLDSEPGRSTTVAILLPRTDELPQPLDAPYTTPSVNTEGLRLLVLEDDEPVASTLTQMLTKLGCVVFTANNTEHALVIVDEHPPDVIIADVILAERRSGLDFLIELRARNKKIPALLISGYAPESIGFEVPKDIALLSKPISTTQLAEAISQARLKQY